MMRRREFMKAFLAATVTHSVLGQAIIPAQAKQGPPAPGPVPWMQGLDHAKLETVETVDPSALAETETVFFNQQEMATLTRLCDLMMPPLRKHPGASAAEVPGFLDFFVSESAGDVQSFYRSGLDWLEGSSKQRLQRSFAQTDTVQADSLLRPYLRTWMSDHYPDDEHERFINAVHHDIRMATLNSQAWAAAVAEDEQAPRKDIYWSPIEPDLQRKPSILAAIQTVTRQ